MDENQMQLLLEKYLRKEATSAEIMELFSAIREDNVLFKKVAEAVKIDLTEITNIPSETKQEILSIIFSAAKHDIYRDDNYDDPHLAHLTIPAVDDISENNGAARTVPFFKSGWFRYAAAILVFIGIGSYFYYNKEDKKNQESASIKHIPVQNDVPAPSLSRATLTLANGQTLILDSAATGTLTMQGSVTIKKTVDGRIVYDPEGGNNALQYNILSVPKGSKIAHIVLSDGSVVYLNSASSLKYPVSFNGSERRVEIIGEAYFEVVKNTQQPFIVQTPTDVITVLGTHFNVNAYKDEGAVRTTLLEGSVKTNQSILKPGEQYSEGIIAKVDPLQVIAWKNGNFYFDDLDLRSILRQYARWYDIEVFIEGSLNTRKYFGIIKRTSSLTNVLKALQYNDIEFRIEENKLYVKSM